MTELMRAATLKDFPEMARSVGLNPDALLAEVGIDRRAFGDAEMRIPARSIGQLYELAAKKSGIESFGVRLAETRNIAILGPIGLLVREESTVRHGLEAMISFSALHNEAIGLHLDGVEDQAILWMEYLFARPVPFRQGVELIVGVLYRVLKSLVGPDLMATVCFTHEPPAKRTDHHRLFGPRVDFRCNYNGIIFPARHLEQAVLGANPTFAEHARRYLESLAGDTATSIGTKVRDLVRVQLSSGRCTIDRMAQQLGCDRRTLQRRLAAEDTTFHDILDAVRAEMAVRLLQNRQASLAATADMLGFSGDSAFSRWFLDRFGARPSEWRRQLDLPH